jgi:signal-transduction protein with cAMP-binding, CBS, and nucleotidyltransferase domain
MKIGELCSRQVVTIDPKASLREAAAAMRNAHVGALVAVEGEGPAARPVGILTDRDIVVAVIAVPGARPEGIRVCDAMSSRLAVAREDDGVFEAVAEMRERSVRRLPVLARDGRLVGIVTLEDLLAVISTELANLSEALRWSRKAELERRAPLQAPR